jgi:hypothetical protein
MMKNFNQLFLSGITSLILLLNAGCSRPIEGEGPVISKNVNAGDFTEIELEIPATLTIAISDSSAAVINAQQNIASMIELSNDGDCLTIKSEEEYRSSHPVEIILSTRKLEKLVVNGRGDVNVINPVRGSGLRVIINGSGDIRVKTDVEKLRTEINGSGDITYEGQAGSHRIRMNGSGNVNASELSAEKCDIHINGSGDADLRVTSLLEARVLGSGNIRYSGTPEVNSKITGSGNVTKN